MAHNESNPFPKEDIATQITRQGTVVSYIALDDKTRKARPLAVFQFPEGETPIYPRKGESMMYPDPHGAFIVDDVIHANKFHNGLYTHIVTLLMKPSKKNRMSGISLN